MGQRAQPIAELAGPNRRFQIPSDAIVRAACALFVVLLGVAIVLTVLTDDPWPANDGLLVVLDLAFVGVGIVVARRQPRNAVGWLLLVVGLVDLFHSDMKLYLVLDYRLHHGDLPGGPTVVYWIGAYTILPMLIGLPAILLFPDGRLPSRRWRLVLQVYVVGAVLFIASQFVGQSSVSAGPHVAIDVRGTGPNTDDSFIAGIGWVLAPGFLLLWIAFVGHQIASWRRSDGDLREQVKWLMSGGLICVVSCVTIVMFGDGYSETARIAADVSTVGITALPISIGVGVLKYRLYGIDRLISRSLSYTILTGLLAAVFIGTVLVATRLLPLSSPVGVAASTLAAAALFNPLRTRVQRGVDRRFNRARYDAARIVAAFNSRLRDSVDLDSVHGALVETVDRVVEPAHLTLWIRPPGG